MNTNLLNTGLYKKCPEKERNPENLITGHLGKGLVQLVGDGLEFLFFMNKFIAGQELVSLYKRLGGGCYMFWMSWKAASISSCIFLFFSLDTSSSSSSLSTSFCSFCTDLSANSALASACFNLVVRVLICSL